MVLVMTLVGAGIARHSSSDDTVQSQRKVQTGMGRAMPAPTLICFVSEKVLANKTHDDV